MTEKLEFVSGITFKSLVFGVVYAVSMTFFLQWASVICHNQALGLPWSQNEMWPTMLLSGVIGGFFPMTFLFFLVPTLVPRVLPEKYRFKPAELAFIFSLIATVPVMADQGQGLSLAFWSKYSSEATNAVRGPVMLSSLSSLLLPKNSDVLTPMKLGGAVVPWDSWLMPLAYWITFFLAFRLFFFFGAGILSSLFIDVENLAFPCATVANQTISIFEAKKEEKPKFGKKLPLMGIAIAILYMLGRTTQYWYPPFAAGASAYYIGGSWSIDLNPQGFINGVLNFDFDIMVFAWALILPIEVCISTPIFWVIIFMILPPILTQMGHTVPIGASSSAQVAWDRFVRGTIFTGTITGNIRPFSWGLIAAIGLFPLVLNYKYFVGSIKRATKGGEARFYWAGWSITGIILLILVTAIQIPIEYSFLLIFLWSTTYLGYSRAAVEGGLYEGLYHVASPLDYTLCPSIVYYFGYPVQFANSISAYNYEALGSLLMEANESPMRSNPLHWYLMSFKLGSLTRTRKRDLMIGIMLGAIIPVVICLPFGLWLTYNIGWANRHLQLLNLTNAYNLSKGLVIENVVPNLSLWTGMVLGFAVAASLMVARIRFRAFSYVTPLGILFALLGGGWHVWFQFLIVALIRLLLYRVGGRTLYENKVVPTVIGMIIGQALYYALFIAVMISRGLGYTWW